MGVDVIEHLSPIAVDSEQSSEFDGLYSCEELSEALPALIRLCKGNFEAYGLTYKIADDSEPDGDQLDPTHLLYFLRHEGRLTLAPIDEDASISVLDAKAGTGIWAMNFAEKFSNSSVSSCDLSPIQLETPYGDNLTFVIADMNESWNADFSANQFDFVHSRDANGIIKNWTTYAKEAFKVLKPGGWFELHYRSLNMYSEDGGNIPEILDIWWADTENTHQKLFMMENPTPHIPDALEETGYENISHHRYKIPIGTWPENGSEKEIGALSLFDFLTRADGAVYLFTRLMGKTYDQARENMERIKEALRNKDNHLYCIEDHFIAQKPFD